MHKWKWATGICEGMNFADQKTLFGLPQELLLKKKKKGSMRELSHVGVFQADVTEELEGKRK